MPLPIVTKPLVIVVVAPSCEDPAPIGLLPELVCFNAVVVAAVAIVVDDGLGRCLSLEEAAVFNLVSLFTVEGAPKAEPLK